VSARKGLGCVKAPQGWHCSRVAAHYGPCALWPRPWRHPLLWLEMWRGPRKAPPPLTKEDRS